MKSRISSRGFVALSLAATTLCALALRFVAITLPSSVLGENLLRFEYAHADDKSAYLSEYRALIWEHGGGYVPDNAARFFAARLDEADSSHGDEEVAAIARFYASQGGMREGNFGQLLTERARQRLIDAILRDWKTYPEKNAWRAFVFIETLRKNKYLGKAQLQRTFGGNYMRSFAQLAPVAAKLDAWNRRYRKTPVIWRPDPLAGTDYFIAGT